MAGTLTCFILLNYQTSSQTYIKIFPSLPIPSLPFPSTWSNWGLEKLRLAQAKTVSPKARILAQVCMVSKPGAFPLLQDVSGWLLTAQPSLGLFVTQSSFHITWYLVCARLILLIKWDGIYRSIQYNAGSQKRMVFSLLFCLKKWK